ncbi:ABC transporter permease [Microterricola viridarii]|uniref:Peptide/nickel transport system permease protein n=1 Tax=Microterricola viridarii TaxID=412690 RepID=A0A1H1YI42_9MICO|nr:ABC transporter permease [Microterricola viridarii]SDT20706.1 peptide/nickel transport system permease protein [Microterricola viridarii]
MTAAPAVTPAVRARTSWFARGGWPSFLARRLGVFALSLWGLVTAAFLMLQLIPGDPVRMAVGLNASVEVVEAMRAHLGLDLPLWEQYTRFIGGLLTGNPGDSIKLHIPVVQVIADRLPATLELALLTIVVVLLLAVPIGIAFAALTRGGRRRGVEIGYTATSGIFAVIPEFLFGVGLVYLFAVTVPVLPVAGRTGPESYILPVAALALGGIASLSRIVRAEALGVLDADYIRTARAKRMPTALLYLRHALPNLLTPTLTMAGLMLGSLIAGTVLVESIFAWPGLGQTLVSSITGKDYPLAQTLVVVYGGMVLLVNLIVDIVLALVDPRSTIKEV